MSFAVEMRYPSEAKKNGTQGEVVVKGTVNKEGSLVGIYVEEGIGDGCSKEALRAMKLLDAKWLPALDLRGKPIAYVITIPIVFRLN